MKCRLRLSRSCFPVFAFFFLAMNAGFSVAAPVEGRVVQGAVSLTYDPPVLRIVQQTQDAVVQWRSFNLAVGERVEIVQPSQNSRLINRVTAGGISDIRGSIQGNGQIFLINPRGIHHQKAAHARAGGLILSGLDFDSASPMGNPVRLQDSSPGVIGNIINLGTIETLEGGNAALVGRWVLNRGLITGELSSIALAVGRGVNILFEDKGLINLNVTREEPKVAGVTSAPLGNLGTIITPSGRIFIAGSVSSPAFKLLRDTGGKLASDSEIALAPGAQFTFGLGAKFLNRGPMDTSNPYDGGLPAGRHAGRIVIVADVIDSNAPISSTTSADSTAGQIVMAAADVVSLAAGGDLDVNPGINQAAGAITILGKKILVKDVDISAKEGGKISIGGKGASPSGQLVDTATISAQSNISTDAMYYVGVVRLWAKNAIEFSGKISGTSLRGADISVVSNGTLRFNAVVHTPATSREPQHHGSLLLQAKDILVGPGDAEATVNSLKLDQTLDAAHVTLRAERDIAVSGVTMPAILQDDTLWAVDTHSSSLTLRAGNDIRIDNAGIFDLTQTYLDAGNDIRIHDLVAIGGLGAWDANCHMAAGHDVYIFDSVFMDWCRQENIGAGGVVEVSNTIFQSFGGQ